MSQSDNHTKIRPLDLNSDLNAIADLVVLCFAETLDEDGYSFIQKMRQAASSISIAGMVNFLGLPRNGFVWEENDRIVGNISIITILYHNRPAYLIANVAVHPNNRRQGIARKLTEAALEYISSRRVANVLLQANENNSVAFKLYQDFGFEEIARRTSWHAFPDKNLAIQYPEDVFIKQRSSNDWPQQKSWLNPTYPKTVTWHLPYKEQLLRPGILTHLSRLLSDQNIKQWSAYKHDQLIGTLSWQSSKGMADWMWLAVGQDNTELAIRSLLMHSRIVSRPGRRILVNYPAGKNVEVFKESGFKHHHTLIWMKLKKQ